MVAHTVFRDVANSLKELMKTNISELTDDSIVFDSPGEIDAVNTTGLSIFLYRVSENMEMKNQNRVQEAQDKLRMPPLYLDLHYLFTPYAKNRETEMIILEGVIQTLYDNPVLGKNVLQGNLINEKDIRAVPLTLGIDDLNKLWGTFPNKSMKPTASYLLTPLAIHSTRVSQITQVKEKEIRLYRMEKEQ